MRTSETAKALHPSEADDGNTWECRADRASAKASAIGEVLSKCNRWTPRGPRGRHAEKERAAKAWNSEVKIDTLNSLCRSQLSRSQARLILLSVPARPSDIRTAVCWDWQRVNRRFWFWPQLGCSLKARGSHGTSWSLICVKS